MSTLSDKFGGKALRRKAKTAAIVLGASLNMAPCGNQAAAAPLTMGNYREEAAPSLYEGSGYKDWAEARRLGYLKDKAELETAITRSASSATEGDARIKSFATMIDSIKKIPDRLTQIEALNAGVNLFNVYDKAEFNEEKPHRSLVETLREGRGVCDETALLKLFALKKLGVADRDVRCVSESAIIDGKDAGFRHVVVLVRVDGETWVMNNQAPPVEKGKIDTGRAIATVIESSRLETPVTHLGLTKQSYFTKKNEAYIPLYGFNESLGDAYKEEPPLPSAAGRWVVLSPADVYRYGLVTTLMPLASSRKIPLGELSAKTSPPRARTPLTPLFQPHRPPTAILLKMAL